VSNEELAREIKFVRWDRELLLKAVEEYMKVPLRHDLSGAISPQDAALTLLHAAPFTYALGRGGIVVIGPIHSGLSLCHICIWDRRYMGRPEMLREVARDAFSRWGLHRIGAVIPTTNTLAIRLAERVGFKREGVLRSATLRYNGERGDAVMLGLLPQEV